jgi:hypothetical protein
VAYFAVRLFTNDEISRLKLIMFEFCVEFFHFSQVVLDLAVLLYSQLVVKDGRKEADQVAVR